MSSPQNSAPLGRRRGPKPTFTLDDVIAEVLQHDLSTVSISAVARSLQVAPSALYRVVPDRESLVALALHRIAETITLSAESECWQDTLRNLSQTMWETAEQYPGLDAVILTQPGALLHLETVSRAVVDQLTSQGLTLDEASFALDIVGDTILANHIASVCYRNGGLERVRTKLAAGDYGITPQDATPVIYPDDTWLDTAVLEPKIECIIAGLEKTIDAKSSAE